MPMEPAPLRYIGVQGTRWQTSTGLNVPCGAVGALAQQARSGLPGARAEREPERVTQARACRKGRPRAHSTPCRIKRTRREMLCIRLAHRLEQSISTTASRKSLLRAASGSLVALESPIVAPFPDRDSHSAHKCPRAAFFLLSNSIAQSCAGHHGSSSNAAEMVTHSFSVPPPRGRPPADRKPE